MFFIAEDWNVVSHFLPLIREARANGLDVLVATRVKDHGRDIEATGARVIALNTDPRTTSTTKNARLIFDLAGLVRREKPDIVYCVTIRMCVFGGTAARLAGARNLILAPTGLGHLWIVQARRHTLLRNLTRFGLTHVLSLGGPTRYVFENDEDPREIGLNTRHNITIIGGAGVDDGAFPHMEDPSEVPVKVAVVARMTRQKGIAESIAAVLAAREKGANLELHLYGTSDAANPSSLSPADLKKLVEGKPGITWHGAIANPGDVWRDHAIAMLLSYREGLPRSLVEAIACGRPVVTTDVVGCRSVIRDGIEGFLVPSGDIEATATALARLASDPGLRKTMGLNARNRFVSTFTETAVRAKIGALYRELLARSP